MGKRKIIVLVGFFLLAILLSSCDALSQYIAPPDPSAAQTATASIAQTLTPAAKITPSKFNVISSPACLQAELSAMQTSNPALDQVLWSQQNTSMVYIAPGQSSNWFTGTLVMVTAPQWKDPVQLASNAAGSLVWSPDGNSIAFAALRVEEGVYTVMVVDIKTKKVSDLLPGDAAKQNDWSSPKYVLDWSADGAIDILTSCGLDCRKVLQVFSNGGDGPTKELKEDEIAQISLLPHTNPQAKTPKLTEDAHPVWAHPNWSPDEKRVVYSDLQGVTWVFSPQDMSQYILDNNNGPTEETRWSSDGSLLAIRAHGIIDIYGFKCGQNPLK